MPIGGYKFSGRYCQKGTLTDSQWILLMHRTKVEAFMASNTLSNAGWDYHMAGSPDGNYHCLDDSGNNYVTCFYNSTLDRYFAIYTLCNHTNSGTDTSMVKVLLCNHIGFTTSGTRYYIGKYASNFFRMGQIEIAYNTPLNTVTNYISRLIPVGNLGMDTSNEGSSGYGKTNTLFAESSVMFGYAIKDDNIIMFSGKYVSGQIGTYLGTTVVSGHAFSRLVNEGYDDGTGFLYNTQSTSITVASSYENATRLADVTTLMSPVSQCTMYNGTPTNCSGVMCVPLAYFSTQPTDVPFQAVSIFNLENYDTDIWSKGTINVDLIAVNFPGHQAGLCPSLYSTVANGNYLCVRYTGSTSSSNDYGITFKLGLNNTLIIKYDTALYVGWDTSNPNILQDSSWSLPSNLTVSFTNTSHPEFVVTLPTTISQAFGSSVTLPSISGEFEDEDYTYTPQEWDIGSFGSSVTLTQDLVANLLWQATPKAETKDLLLGMRSSGSGTNAWQSVTYSAGSGYWAGILSQNDRYEAEQLGLQVHTNNWAGTIGGLVIDYTFGIELLSVYSDISGTSEVTKGNNWIFRSGAASSANLMYMIISNTVGFSTSVMSYKARFTKRLSSEIKVYFNSSQTSQTVNANTWYTMYDAYGRAIYFDNGKNYSVIGIYYNDIETMIQSQLGTGKTSSGALYTYIRMFVQEQTTASYAIIRVENAETREAWFKSDKTDYTFSTSTTLYNKFGETFNENFERNLEIVKFVDANDNDVQATLTSYSLSYTSGQLLQLVPKTGAATFTAAKVVYRSMPLTKRAWLNTSHTGQNLNAYTIYTLYDESGNRPPELSVTDGALLGLYDENGNAISFSSSYDTVTNREGYLNLYIGNSAHSNVAYIIYKET